ncbi:MAG: YigZ family protein [Trueperaceae bacterium]|nr:YigZ family protein [Truepera sp.]HRQ10355.1 YigZ family protein [Trueperaceae bacterium]
MAHSTIARAAMHEEVVQGSRFIAYADVAGAVGAATDHLAAIRAEHPAATHHCWAYKIGTAQRFSDDGEPGGTAGRPMLEVILKRGLDHVSAVVVRYFGGKKLGAGGLVRAYSGSLAKALDLAGTHEVPDTLSVTVRAPFAYTDAVLRLLDSYSKTHAPFVREAPEFDGAGLVARVTLAVHDEGGLLRDLTELTQGTARLQADAD